MEYFKHAGFSVLGDVRWYKFYGYEDGNGLLVSVERMETDYFVVILYRHEFVMEKSFSTERGAFEAAKATVEHYGFTIK